MTAEQPIILVDGTSFLFRAYHAIREPLATSDGRATHAILGTINMLRSLTREYQPARLAMVMDAKGKTFRNEMYPSYKANRPPMPDDLRMQLDYVKQIVPAMGIALVSVPGVEADDVIGTLAVEASKRGFHTLIVSSDKDLAQLVDERVEMVDTMKKTRLDAAGVTEKYGVPPHKMVEYLALMGDSSDNIPGVPGVGPKTAVKWLIEFGSLEQIVAQADEITGKVGESLRENLEQLALSRDLATIRCDLALECSLDDLQVGAPDTDKLREIYTDLEFHSWLKRLDSDHAGNDADHHAEQGSDDKPPVDDDKAAPLYETITDAKTLARWIVKLKKSKLFAIDTETTSKDAHRAELVGLSFATTPGAAAYLPLRHRYAGVPAQLPFEQTLEKLRPILEDPKRAKTGQNLKYDKEVLHHHGITLRGITHDTMLMSYLLEAGTSRHDMDTLALKHLGYQTIKFSQVAGSGKNQLTFDEVDLHQATRYAAEDADITLQLHRTLAPRLESDKALAKLFHEIEMPLIDALARTETNGVKVDADMLRRQSVAIADRLKKIEKNVFAVAGESFNIASPKQIQEILYVKQGIPVLRRTPKGQPSTAEGVLQELAAEHELPRLILEHRGLAKLKNTYTDKLPDLVNPKTGRIHTSYHQAVASTGRLSSSDPNLQNIPVRSEEGRHIREAFIAESGCVLLSADYSQIELRIMAHLSGDAGLTEAFNHGLDVHNATAAEVFDTTVDKVDAEQRRRAKAINFGLIYGMSAFGLARQLKIDQKQARGYMEVYFDRYPGVKKYMEQIVETAREQGYVETLYGRRLNLPEIRSKNAPRRQSAERTAINAPMQGSAADIIKLAMLAVDQWIIDNHANAKIILQVHDELVLEVVADEGEKVSRITAELMANVASLNVPLVVDTGIGANWKEAH